MAGLADKLARLMSKANGLAEIRKHLTDLQSQTESNCENLKNLKKTYQQTYADYERVEKIIKVLETLDTPIKAEIAAIDKKLAIIQSRL